MPTRTSTPARRPARATRPLGPRLSAADRRTQVLRAAMAEFARKGLDGTSTELIAKRAGISQPYVFRLYPSKRDLFLAAIDECFSRVERDFERAARASKDPTPEGRLHEMGHAYIEMLRHREQLMMQMHSYVACAEPEVRKLVRRRWEHLHEMVARLSGAPAARLEQFFATGMLLNVLVLMHMDEGRDIHQWFHEVLHK